MVGIIQTELLDSRLPESTAPSAGVTPSTTTVAQSTTTNPTTEPAEMVDDDGEALTITDSNIEWDADILAEQRNDGNGASKGGCQYLTRIMRLVV
jgi:hypothetical protein